MGGDGRALPRPQRGGRGAADRRGVGAVAARIRGAGFRLAVDRGAGGGDANPGAAEVRARAIRLALWYGIVPSRFYEAEPHHSWSYWRHLGVNLAQAWRWLTHTQTPEDEAFERRVNASRDLRRP